MVQNVVQAGPHHGPIQIGIDSTRRGADYGDGEGPRQGHRADGAREGVRPVLTTREEGSGIGLSIAQRVLALHAGQAEIDSTPGLGTTLTIAPPLNVPLTQPGEPALAAGGMGSRHGAA